VSLRNNFIDISIILSQLCFYIKHFGAIVVFHPSICSSIYYRCLAIASSTTTICAREIHHQSKLSLTLTFRLSGASLRSRNHREIDKFGLRVYRVD